MTKPMFGSSRRVCWFVALVSVAGCAEGESAPAPLVTGELRFSAPLELAEGNDSRALIAVAEANDDGWLDVFLAKNDFSTALGVLASAVHITHLENVLQHHRGRDIRVESDPIQKFSCDGERIGATPFHVRIVPKAVRIFVPQLAEE